MAKIDTMTDDTPDHDQRTETVPAAGTALSTRPTFLQAIERIEARTREIRRDGLAGFEAAEAAYAEVQALRAVLQTRLTDLRRCGG